MRSIIFLLLIVGCGLAKARDVVYSDVPRVETIFGLSTIADLVQIRVESNGCTTKHSFYVQKQRGHDDGIIKLLFIRRRADLCKAYWPEGVTLKFSKEELGLTSDNLIRVDNPFGINRHSRN